MALQMTMQQEQSRALLPEVLATFCVFTTMLDSGGELGLRSIGLLLLVVLCWRNPTVSFKSSMLIGWLAIVMLLLPSVLRSAFNGVELTNILVWIYPFLFFPLIYIMARSSRLSERIFVNAGLCFALVIVLLFIGRITGDERLMWLNDQLTANASGFFNQKQAFFEDAMPVVYFQGTLSLVFVSILAIGRKRYFQYFVMLLALILAPSRFGVTISILSAFVVFFVNLKTAKAQLASVLFALFALTAGVLILPNGFVEIFNHESHGSRVRIGHVNSVEDVVDADPTIALLGAGPGTSFYSSGFDEYTDNIEISQLELLRKYGAVFFAALMTFFLALIVVLWRIRRRHTACALIAQFIVATSNPVLLSSSFILFLSVALSETEDVK